MGGSEVQGLTISRYIIKPLCGLWPNLQIGICKNSSKIEFHVWQKLGTHFVELIGFMVCKMTSLNSLSFLENNAMLLEIFAFLSEFFVKLQVKSLD